MKDETVLGVTNYVMYFETQESALIEKSAFIIGEKPAVPESIHVVDAGVNQDVRSLPVMYGVEYCTRFQANIKI